jgi:hypothetical protein
MGPYLYHIIHIMNHISGVMSQKKSASFETDFQNPENNLSHNFFKVFNKNVLLVF